MTHPMDMSLYKQGWALAGGELDEVAIEFVNSQQFGAALIVKLLFASGRESVIEVELKEGTGSEVYAKLMVEIAGGAQEKDEIKRLGESDDLGSAL